MKLRTAIYILLTAILLSAGMQAFAQDKETLKKEKAKEDGPNTSYVMKDTFKLSTKRNDPRDMPNLNIMLNPAYLDIYGLNMNMGYDIRAYYTLKNQWNFWAAYEGTYFETVNKNTIDEENSLGGPARDPLNFMHGEIGVAYYLKSDLQDIDEPVRLGRYGGGMLVRRVPGQYLVNTGLRLGLQYHQTYISGDQVNFSGYYLNDPNKTVRQFGLGQVGTNMQENVVSVGGIRTEVHDLQVDNSTVGKKGIQYKTNLYGDLLIAPAIAYTNVIMKNYSSISREPYTDFNINSSTPKSRIGFRVGYEYIGFTRPGLTFGLETGAMPGPSFFSGLYLMARFGVAINAKI